MIDCCRCVAGNLFRHSQKKCIAFDTKKQLSQRKFLHSRCNVNVRAVSTDVCALDKLLGENVLPKILNEAAGTRTIGS